MVHYPTDGADCCLNSYYIATTDNRTSRYLGLCYLRTQGVRITVVRLYLRTLPIHAKIVAIYTPKMPKIAVKPESLLVFHHLSHLDGPFNYFGALDGVGTSALFPFMPKSCNLCPKNAKMGKKARVFALFVPTCNIGWLLNYLIPFLRSSNQLFLGPSWHWNLHILHIRAKTRLELQNPHHAMNK